MPAPSPKGSSGSPYAATKTLDLLSQWTRFRPSLCKGCWAGCCRLPVEVSVADLIRMGVASEDEATSSLKKLARRLESQGVIKSFRSTTGLFTLAQKPSGGCIYLDEQNLCRIYDSRPDVCRRFPHIGPRPGYCPARHGSHSVSINKNQ